MTDYIGISAYYHDSSVALIRDGKLKLFLKEESLTRVKGSSHFPIESLKYLVKNYDVSEDKIGKICFYEKPLRGWLSLLSYSLQRPIESWKQSSILLKKFWDGPIFIADEVRKIFPNSVGKIIYSDHHLSHALCGLSYADKSKDWTIMVIDGVGDGETFSEYIFRDGKIDRMSCQNFPNSLGIFYSTITDYLGYSINDGEYKVMALASYGEPTWFDFMKNKMIKQMTPKFELNMDYFDFHKNPERSFSKKLVDKLGPSAKDVVDPYKVGSKNFARLADIAASAQSITEDVIKKTVRNSISQSGIRNVVFSGGVAQNCKAVAELIKIEEIDDLIVPPSPGDSGAALGAALFGFTISEKKNVPSASLYPGGSPEFSDIFSELFVQRVSGNEKFQRAAELIKNGEILATFFGNSEMGPRALGHRSLLCNAGNKYTVERLNLVIKKREAFRPLAPIVMEKNADRYFYLNKKCLDLYTWMGCTADVKSKTYEKYDSIIHIDGSARVQVVKEDPSELSHLLSQCDLLDMHILVNTSFNISGDPIVFDHIDCFVNMERMNLNWLITDTGLYERVNV